MGLTEGDPKSKRPGAAWKETALGIIVTLLFFLSLSLLPAAGFFTGLFTPLPSLLAVAKIGSPFGYLVPAGAAVTCFPILAALGLGGGIPYLSALLAVGTILGLATRRHWSTERAILLSSLIFAGAGAVLIWLSTLGSEGGMLAALELDLGNAVKGVLALLGPGSAEYAGLQEAMLAAVPVIARLTPGIAVSSAFLVCWLNLVAARRYFRATSAPELAWEDWSVWKAPDHLVWGVIGAGFAILVSSGLLRYAGLNVLLILGTIYFLQGLAVISFFFERWRLPRFFRAVIYALVLVQQLASMAAVLLGFFDMWLDFRRLVRKQDSAHQA